VNQRHKEIIQLRNEKLLTYRQIAAELGCSYTLPHKVLKRYAPHLMSKRSSIIVRRNLYEIIKFRKQGMTYKDIGDRVGLPKGTVERAIRKYAPELIRKSISKEERERRIKKVAELQRQGFKNREIAEKLGFTKGMVDQYLIEAGKEGIPLLAKRRVYPKLTPAQIEKRDREIIRLYEQGVPAKEVAEKFDMVFGRVYQIVWKEKPEINIKKHKERERRDKNILNMVKAGISYSKIAETFGVGVSTVGMVVIKSKTREQSL
jgi:transposase